MKTIINLDGNLKITGSREQSLVNVTLDFWNDNDERWLEIFCQVRIIGEPKVERIFNPILNPDSQNPTMIFNLDCVPSDINFGNLKTIFSKQFVDNAEKCAIQIAMMHNAPENETIKYSNQF